jgi:hypothetical protein
LQIAAARWIGSRLRRCNGVRYALLDPILKELAGEGRIRITGEVISLI